MAAMRERTPQQFRIVESVTDIQTEIVCVHLVVGMGYLSELALKSI